MKDLWDDSKIKYEVYIYNYQLIYTCVSTKPIHEVIETLNKMFCREKTEAKIYLVDKNTHKRSLLFTVKKLLGKKEGRRNVKKIYDTKTKVTYNNSISAEKATGIIFSSIIRDCKKNIDKKRFVYIK
jgi:hypothetical protein